MNVKKYLSRLNFDSAPSPDLSNLKKLHRNHLYNIPFENLDIHYNRKIILNVDLLEKKIIDENRGGFCYELNGLFYTLLSNLGYSVKMISAGVYNSEGIPGPAYDHMALIVNIDNQEYLVDVGFGENFIEPLKFALDTVQKDESGYFKIISQDEKYILCSSPDGENFKKGYLFTTEEEELSNFEDRCLYMQTSSESHFTQKKICSKATGKGRISISDLKVIVTEKGIKTETSLKDENDFLDSLNKYFGIVLK